MSLTIPLRQGLPYFSLQVQLEAVTYTLTFRWNDRQSAWFMDIANEDESTIYESGVRVVVGYPLAVNTANRQPPGVFIAIDTTKKDEDPGLNELGARVQLLYFSAAELGL